MQKLKIKNNQKMFAVIMIFILLINLALPMLSSPSVVFADEGGAGKVSEGRDGLKVQISPNNVAGKKETFEKIKDHMTYSEEMHKQIIKRILMDSTFQSETYRDLYEGDASLAETNIGNDKLFKVFGDEVGGSDKLLDSEIDTSSIHGIYWIPIYSVVSPSLDNQLKSLVSDYGGNYTMDLAVYAINGSDTVAKLATAPTSMKTLDAVSKKGDVTMKDYFISITGDDGKSIKPRPIFVTDMTDYEECGTWTWFTQTCASEFVVVSEISNGIMGNSPPPFQTQQSIGYDKSFRLEEGKLAQHAQLYANGPHTEKRTGEQIGKGTYYPYGVSRTAWYSFKNKFSIAGPNSTSNNKKEDLGRQMLGIDSYGNIVNNNLDVIVPFWHNNILQDGYDSFLSNGVFLSHPMLKEITENGSTALSPVITNSSMNFYEFEHKDIADQLGSCINGTTFSGSATCFKTAYKSEKFIDSVVDLIFEITKDDIKAFNERMLKSVAKVESGEAREMYIVPSNGNYDEFVSESITTLEEAKEYIYSAEGLLARIGRILDIGLFELLRLTVAAGVSDFYNSTVINYSVGDIFYTTLLSESDLWSKIINTLLIIVVSFMSVYLILMLVRLLMGYITIKGIVLRFIILAIATISPMIVYSPLVNLAFNKPVDMTLGTELERMYMLDNWLQRWVDKLDKDQDLAVFLPDSNLRERFEEYTIPFYTSTHVDGYDLNDPEQLTQVGGKPHPNDVVVVNVSAFHLMLWAREAADDVNLFQFLSSNYPEFYSSLSKYKEYEYDPSIGDINSSFYKSGTRITASDLFREVYDNIAVDGTSDEKFFNNTLFALTSILMNSERNYDAKYIEKIIFDFASVDYAKKYIYNSESDIASKSESSLVYYSDETKAIADELPNKHVPTTDLLSLENVVRDLKPFRLNDDGSSDPESPELAAEIYNINKKVIDAYIQDYLYLRQAVNPVGQYTYAEQEVLLLKTFFAINEEYDIHLFPTNTQQNSVSLDTYVRALFIPLSEFTPYESDINNVANYISLRSDLIATVAFALAILALFIYGLVKFTVLFVLLMPAILASFFYNYVWLENTKSKAWVGALGILGSFALVNLGLVLMWKLMIYAMNLSVVEATSVGTSMYPVTMFHSALIMLYIIVAFHFILKPLYKTVKGDLKNLGGTSMSDGIMNFGGKIKASMKNFWNGLSDSSARNGSGRLGGNVVSAVKSAKDAFRGPKKDDKGMAGKLDPNQIKANKTKSESEKDKEEVAKVNKKLDEAEKQKNEMKGKNQVNNGMKGAGGAVAKGAGAAVGSAAVGSASQVVPGKNSLVRVLGLAGLSSALKASPGDTRSLMTRLKDAKDAAGKAWLDSDADWNNQKSKNALARATSLVELNDKVNEIPDPVSDTIELDDNDMSVLEETGMDKEISKVEDNTGIDPVMLDTGSDMKADIIASALKGNNRVVSANGKVIIDMEEDKLQDASERKALLNPVLGQIENTINELNSSNVKRTAIGDAMVANKVSDKVYEFDKNEMTPHLVSYINKKKAEGLGVVLQNTTDGKLALHFQNEDEAVSTISELEVKSASIAKALGIRSNSTFDVDSSRLNGFKHELDEAGISYRVREGVSAGVDNIVIEGGHSEVVRVNEILNNNESLSSHVTEIVGGVEKVTDNTLVSQLVRERVDSGELVMGTDVLVQNGSVYAQTDAAKRVLRDIESNYRQDVNLAVQELQDFAIDISRTIVGESGGLDIVTYEKGSDIKVESQLRGSEIGKERYTLNNRSFDVEEFNRTINALETKRTSIDKEIRNEESELQMRDYAINNQKKLIEEALREQFNETNRLKEQMYQRVEQQAKEWADEGLSVHKIQERYENEIRSGESHFEKLTQELYSNYDKENGNILERLNQERESINKKISQRREERSKIFNDVENELLESVSRARANGMNWNRVNGNTLEFSSSIKNQQDTVKNLMSQYEKLAAQTPKNVPPNPRNNPNVGGETPRRPERPEDGRGPTSGRGSNGGRGPETRE